MSNTYIGTFGINQPLANYYQPIHAADVIAAEKLMFERHGKVWAFVYPLEKYKELQDEGYFKGHSPLPCMSSARHEFR